GVVGRGPGVRLSRHAGAAEPRRPGAGAGCQPRLHRGERPARGRGQRRLRDGPEGGRMSDDDPLPFAGEGVVLRRLGAADLGAFQAYRRDAELGRYQGWLPLLDASARAFLEEMGSVPLFRPGEWAQLGIAAPGGGAILGDIGLHLAADGREVEVGFTLARRVHGRGLATAAVRAALQLVFARTAVE